jgi:hypothetical protein
VARIRLDSRKSVRPFKGIVCDDISEFESYMPSQAVRSLVAMRGTPENARHSRQLVRPRAVSEMQIFALSASSRKFGAPVSTPQFHRFESKNRSARNPDSGPVRQPPKQRRVQRDSARRDSAVLSTARVGFSQRSKHRHYRIALEFGAMRARVAYE